MTTRRDTYAGGASSRYLLLGAAVFLTLFGLVMIYSASSITAAVREGSSLHFFIRQLVFIALGGLAAWFIARVDYRTLEHRAPMLWAASVVLLLLTVVIGAVRNGARRWIDLGIFNLQPSELAKLACILLLAAIAVQWMKGRITGGALAARALIVLGVPALLVMVQPDLGTTVTDRKSVV